VKAVIFDLDGTLVDSAPAIRQVGNELLAQMGLDELSLDEARSFIGHGAGRFLERAFAARGLQLDADEFADRLEQFHALYAAAPGDANQPFSGCDTVLRDLRNDGVPIGLCTNKPMAPTQNVLHALGWLELFDTVVSGDCVTLKKPDPAPLWLAAERLGAARPIYVGDSEVDEAAARAAGLAFVLFTKGYRSVPIESLAPDRVFSDHAELPAIIDDLHSVQAREAQDGTSGADL
jgi:phosphoglycolate phosphatase